MTGGYGREVLPKLLEEVPMKHWMFRMAARVQVRAAPPALKIGPLSFGHGLCHFIGEVVNVILS